MGFQLDVVFIIVGCDVAVLVPGPRKWFTGDHLPDAKAVPTIHPSQPIHSDDLPSRRAGNGGVAGPGMDREVKRGVQPERGWRWALQV